MTSESPDAPRAQLARIAVDATPSRVEQALRRMLTAAWALRLIAIAGLVWAFVYAQLQVGDVGRWQLAVRGAIVLIAVIVASIWILAEAWADHERQAARRRRAAQIRAAGARTPGRG